MRRPRLRKVCSSYSVELLFNLVVPESAPRMTVRLLRDRSARPSGPVLRTRSSSSEVSEAADQLQGHLTRESPFVTPPHSGRVLPSPAVPPTTPDSKVKESHELVLPPLP